MGSENCLKEIIQIAKANNVSKLDISGEAFHVEFYNKFEKEEAKKEVKPELEFYPMKEQLKKLSNNNAKLSEDKENVKLFEEDKLLEVFYNDPDEYYKRQEQALTR